MTFWQGLVISLLTGNDNDDKEENSGQRIQNLLICLEMLGFSIAHYFVFPPMEWEEGYIRRRLELGFGDSIAFGDFISDIKMVYKSGKARSDISRKDYSTIGSISTPNPSEQLDFDYEGPDHNRNDEENVVEGMNVVG